MMSIVLMVIIWTWGLTPLWANITTTVLLSLHIVSKLGKAIIKLFAYCVKDDEER